MYEYEKTSCATCPAVGTQEVEVNVPVSVKAHADVGCVRTQCMGPAVIERGCMRNLGDPDAVSRFVISQRIKVDVPVSFGADTDVGAPGVNFEPMMNMNMGPELRGNMMRDEFRHDSCDLYRDGYRSEMMDSRFDDCGCGCDRGYRY